MKEDSFGHSDELQVDAITYNWALNKWLEVWQSIELHNLRKSKKSPHLDWVDDELFEIVQQAQDHLDPEDFRQYAQSAMAMLVLTGAIANDQNLTIHTPDVTGLIELMITSIYGDDSLVTSSSAWQDWTSSSAIPGNIKHYAELVWDIHGYDGLEGPYYAGFLFGYEASKLMLLEDTRDFDLEIGSPMYEFIQRELDIAL